MIERDEQGVRVITDGHAERFDEVVITVEDTNKSVREFYTDKAEVMLIFTGEYDGGKRVDMRMVKLVNQKGKWLISEVKTDPFARTGI